MNAQEIESKLLSLGCPDRAKQAQKFFKTAQGEYAEGDLFLGIRVPQLRSLVKAFEKTPLAELSKSIASPYHEVRLFTLFLLVRKFERGGSSERSEIYHLYLSNTEYVNNWDLVDSSAYQIVGRYLENQDHAILFKLRASPMLWERRIAMISCYWFIKHKNFSTALDVARGLLDDEEDLIHKAVGWMLREIGNRDRATEEQFLKQYYQEMPRTMLRYAIEKFPKERRSEYLKGTI